VDEKMSNNSEDSDSLLDEIFMREYVEDNEIDDGKLNFCNTVIFT